MGFWLAACSLGNVAIKALFVLLFCLPALRICVAQECKLIDLSRKYIYLIRAEKSKNEYGGPQTSKLSVEIIRKADKKLVQKLFIKPGMMLDSFSDCSAVSSHVTGKHAKEEGADNDWGDLIVAD
jgi:hypothetical protein